MRTISNTVGVTLPTVQAEFSLQIQGWPAIMMATPVMITCSKQWRACVLVIILLFAFQRVGHCQADFASQFPIDIQLHDGGHFKIYGLACDGKTYFSKKHGSEESVKELLALPEGNTSAASFGGKTQVLTMAYAVEGTNSSARPMFNFGWVDENGIEGYTRGYSTKRAIRGDDDEGHLLSFSNFPQRSKNMRLRVYNRTGMMGEADLQNPFVSVVPSWPVPKLPQEASAKGEVVRLLEATSSLGPFPKSKWPFNGLDQQWTTLKLQFLKAEDSNANWSLEPAFITFTDATGNRQLGSGVASWESQNLAVKFNNALWPVETIQYQFALRKESGFLTNEFTVITNVLVPEFKTNVSNRVIPINVRTNLLGKNIEIIGFRHGSDPWNEWSRQPNPEKYYSQKLKELDLPGKPLGNPGVLAVRKNMFQGGSSLLIQLFDEANGEEIKIVEGASMTQGSVVEREDNFMVRFPVSTKSISIRLTAKKSIQVTVRAKPELLGRQLQP